MKVRDLLIDASKWTTKTSARNAEGEACSPISKDAVCWCLSGAMLKCYPDTYYDHSWLEIERRLRNHLKILGEYSLLVWNDNPKRTFQDIRDLITTLDI